MIVCFYENFYNIIDTSEKQNYYNDDVSRFFTTLPFEYIIHTRARAGSLITIVTIRYDLANTLQRDTLLKWPLSGRRYAYYKH